MSIQTQDNRHERIPMQSFQEIEEIRRRFDDNVTRSFFRNIWNRFYFEDKLFSPPIDVSEEDDDLLLKVTFPESKYENISVFASGQYKVHVLHLYSAHLSASTFAT